MRYFVMKDPDNETARRSLSGQAEIHKKTDLSSFAEIDYIARQGLISNRLKLLMEKYMPKYNFIPVVYLSIKSGEQLVFWRFNPEPLGGSGAVYDKSGIVTHISLTNIDMPLVFTMRSPKGIYSDIVHMAVAESILRRGILGLKFTAISISGAPLVLEDDNG